MQFKNHLKGYKNLLARLAKPSSLALIRCAAVFERGKVHALLYRSMDLLKCLCCVYAMSLRDSGSSMLYRGVCGCGGAGGYVPLQINSLSLRHLNALAPSQRNNRVHINIPLKRNLY
ncbi:hypothetical protein EVAR_80183_1 [Eumeta japonica]|uniref:Uncharacterized protein n=1 Tax=Eumeta variegata TaxID=151549 RepID=A0A4C1UB52_EUMVA|nr:hypothetical protein EVAR_80183_1 [Eumeta japonica]